MEWATGIYDAYRKLTSRINRQRFLRVSKKRPRVAGGTAFGGNTTAKKNFHYLKRMLKEVPHCSQTEPSESAEFYIARLNWSGLVQLYDFICILYYRGKESSNDALTIHNTTHIVATKVSVIQQKQSAVCMACRPSWRFTNHCDCCESSDQRNVYNVNYNNERVLLLFTLSLRRVHKPSKLYSIKYI